MSAPLLSQLAPGKPPSTSPSSIAATSTHALTAHEEKERARAIADTSLTALAASWTSADSFTIPDAGPRQHDTAPDYRSVARDAARRAETLRHAAIAPRIAPASVLALVLCAFAMSLGLGLGIGSAPVPIDAGASDGGSE